MKGSIRIGTAAACLLILWLDVSMQAQQDGTTNPNANASVQAPASSTSTVVPRLAQFNGTVTDGTGKAVSGPVQITFSLYPLQEGGTPLWTETQNITLDSEGHYTVLLGANSSEGLPLDLFTSGTARWLGVTPDLPGTGEQPRVLLVGMPYALKAADADTLGGLPASAFMQVAPEIVPGGLNSSKVAKSKSESSAFSTIVGAGSANSVPLWTATYTIQNSNLFQSGGNLGIGTTAPSAALEVNGTAKFDQPVTFASTQTFSGATGAFSGSSSPVVLGTNTANGSYGQLGTSASGYATGVYGSAATYGVYGSSNGGYGVYGSSNGAYGVWGSSNYSTGVYGSSSSGYGVYGSSNSVVGVGGSSSSGQGMFGNSSTGTGVYGYSNSGSGMSGKSNSGVGVEGSSSNSYGVYGSSSSSAGVYGYSTNGVGVYGSSRGSTGVAGVYGYGGGGVPGVYGYSDADVAGVFGYNSLAYGTGVSGYSEAGVAVEGYSEAGYAVYSEGNFAVSPSGTKSAIAVLPDDRAVLLYSMESPENWYEDFGSAQLQNGVANVELDATFAQTVSPEAGYHVFITPKGDCDGLYVAQETAAGFQVRELRGGKSNVSFDYRIVAKRKGLEKLRLEVVSADHETAESMRAQLAQRPTRTPRLPHPKPPQPPKEVPAKAEVALAPPATTLQNPPARATPPASPETGP